MKLPLAQPESPAPFDDIDVELFCEQSARNPVGCVRERNGEGEGTEPAAVRLAHAEGLAALRLEGARTGELRAGPELVHIDVTNACNLDCTPCWNYSPLLNTPKTARWKRQRLDPALYERAIAAVERLGCRRVLMSGGGEPFFHPNIYDFLADAKRRGMHVTVITNGTVLDWQRTADIGVDRLLVNTCSASAPTYVAYHPNQPLATFDALIAGMKSVANRIDINMVQVITRTNLFELVEMIDLALAVRANRVSFKLVGVSNGTEPLAPTDDERRQLLDDLIPRATTRALALGVRENLATLASQLSGETAARFPIASIGCHAGYYYSRIYVDGRVFFCCEHYEVGNLREMAYDDIWWSPRYDEWRERMRRGEFLPACYRCGKYELNHQVHERLLAQRKESTSPIG